MINLAAMARLVNVMREFNPVVAQQAVTELYELQQAVNRIDLNTQRILALLDPSQRIGPTAALAAIGEDAARTLTVINGNGDAAQ